MIFCKYAYFIVYGKPNKYRCYALTADDLSYAKLLHDEGYDETMAETIACENHFGNVYSMGVDKYAPGCGKCSCCSIGKSGL